MILVLYGHREGLEIIYDVNGNLRVESDEFVLRKQNRIFPRIYKNWELYGVSLVFEPLFMGTIYITNKRIVFIGESDPKIPSEFRDFFSIPLEEVYGSEQKKKATVTGHDINIYIQDVDGNRYTLSMVVPDVGDEGIYPLIRDIEVDDLKKLKKNPKFYHSKVSYVLRNIWSRYIIAPEAEGKAISDELGKEPCIIEDVFVVSKDGIMIKHETWKSKSDMDDDIFSSMVFTLQNFIKDTFKADLDIDLKEVDLGNFKIYIEKGNYLYLIVVYTGRINDKVRNLVRGAISEIETLNQSVLASWNGDPEKIRGLEEILSRLFT